jgi:chorismate--pyruvate lyase
MTHDAGSRSTSQRDFPAGDSYQAGSVAIAGLDPGLRRWLTCTGLLTERLATLPGVALRHLAETDIPLTDGQRRLMQTTDQTGRLREISLQAGDTRYVYGTSLIPASLLVSYPWLGDLGEQPLGATLTARLDVTRSEFRFRRVNPGEPLAQRATATNPAEPGAASNLWARRSTFRLPGGRILVTEVFLPALTPWPIS